MLQHAQELLAGGKRDYAIFAPVEDECWSLYLCKALFISRQGINAMLARCREHAGERFLHPWSNAGFVALFGEFIRDQLAIIGKDVDQPLHLGDAWGIAPDRIQPFGNWEAYTHWPHENELMDPFRMLQCGGQSDGGAH